MNSIATNRPVETLFDIDLFLWADWNQIFEDTLKFYDIEFKLYSMKKFNGMTCTRDLNGKLTIFNNENNIVFDDFIINIDEFRDLIKL